MKSSLPKTPVPYLVGGEGVQTQCLYQVAMVRLTLLSNSMILTWHTFLRKVIFHAICSYIEFLKPYIMYT